MVAFVLINRFQPPPHRSTCFGFIQKYLYALSVSKPIIFLDFDDTLMHTKDAVIDFCNDHYKIKISKEEYHCGNNLEKIVSAHLPEGEDVSRSDFYTHYGSEFLPSHKWHSGVYPVEGVADVIPQLSKKYDLWIVTARQKGSSEVVQSLIDKFLPGSISGTHHVWEHLGNGEFKESPKKDFIESFKGEKILFIDDNPAEVQKTMKIIDSCLFDPHDFHFEEEVPSRVKSWRDIAERLL